MKKITKPKISIQENHLPKGWNEHLVATQKIGGVVLVFVEGKNQKELAEKTRRIKQFVKVLYKEYR